MTHLQHIVLFKFPEPLSTADEAALFAMVDHWPQSIGTMSQCRISTDVSGRSRGYQYLLLTAFRDADALAAYAVHPVHQEFLAFLEVRNCERLAFDSAIDD